MRSVLFMIAFLGLHLPASDVHAQELNAKTAMDNFQDENVLAYMAGLYSGMTWYNARLKQAGFQVLFCPPENEPLDGPRVVGAMRVYAEKPENRRLLEAPAGLLMLVAMQATFPCPVAR